MDLARDSIFEDRPFTSDQDLVRFKHHMAPIAATSNTMAAANRCVNMSLSGSLKRRIPSLSAPLRPWPSQRPLSSAVLQVHVRLQLEHTARISSHVRPASTGTRKLPPATFSVVVCQIRSQSTGPAADLSGGNGARGQPLPPPPPPGGRGSIFRTLLRALGGSLRSLFTPFQGQTLRTLFRSNPEELVLALAM